MPTLGRRWSSIAGHASLIFLAVPPIAVGAAAYVAARTALRGRLGPVLASPVVRRVGHAVVGIAFALAAVNSVRAVVEIVDA